MGLPDYLIIGAQRCGTTSMMHYIANHPGIGRVPRQELHFFTRKWERGWGWYESQFGDEPGKLHGEKSPSYLAYAIAPERIKDSGLNLKFIVLLRDPIERMLSHYRMKVALYNIHKSFDEAKWDDMLKRGHYAEQLKRWFSYFPRERFLILKSEEFFADTKNQMNQVWDFLELERWHPEKYRQYAGISFNVSPSDESLRKMGEYFAPLQVELEELWT